MIKLLPAGRAWSLVVALSLSLLAVPPAQAKTVRVAIVPLTAHSSQDISFLVQGIRDMLASRMATGEISVVDAAQLEAAGGGSKTPLTAGTAIDLAKKVQADFIIFGSLTKLGPQYSLDWRIIKLEDPSRPLGLARTATEDTMIGMVDEMAGLARDVISGKPPTILVATPKPAAAAPAGAKAPKVPAVFSPTGGVMTDISAAAATFMTDQETVGHSIFKTTLVLPRPMGLAVGDVDGDKDDEAILFTEDLVSIYSLKTEAPAMIHRFKSPLSGRLIMVSAGDIDNDGKAELALTVTEKRMAYSALFKLDGGKPVQLTPTRRGSLRFVYPTHKKEVILAGQDCWPDKFFAGPYLRYTLSGGKLVTAGPIPGQEAIMFPTLTFWDPENKGQFVYTGLGSTEKFTVANAAGRAVFRSDKVFGGTNNFIEGVDVPTGDADSGEKPPLDINAPFALCDLDGDGQEELLVLVNDEAVARLTLVFRNFKRGRISAFKWKDGGPINFLNSPIVPQYVCGVGAARVNGKNILVMAATQPVMFNDPFHSARGYIITSPIIIGK